MTAEQTVAILPELIGVLSLIGLVYLVDLCRMIYRDFLK